MQSQIFTIWHLQKALRLYLLGLMGNAEHCHDRHYLCHWATFLLEVIELTDETENKLLIHYNLLSFALYLLLLYKNYKSSQNNFKDADVVSG